jgi:hypothetical protein
MNDCFEALKFFFEQNPLSLQAAESLHVGREISLEILDSSLERHFFTFTKNSTTKKNTFEGRKSEKPDFSFEIPQKVAEELTQRNFSSIAEVGLFIFEKMLSNEVESKIRVRASIGFLAFLTSGYPGILTSGGIQVAQFLASKGFGNVSKINEALSRLQG